ncbi:SGF29 tudor-like domain containing protein [Nitzschia inconspicua]|uniref:SGF29 tudor-like domain containing protein n=1 Tax=Nitzschia inconspicua TaxID=303405 RepID=A0A9K3LGT4_9STRA|nr:SGF29 tudor-like domain containing protein [Nitzschia inconspicua]
MAPPGLGSPPLKSSEHKSGSAIKKKAVKSVSRSYPRGVGMDFRKLAGLTLVNYIDHHGVNVRPEAPPSELAVAVARHFEQMEVDEEECIGGFLERLEKGPTVVTECARKSQIYPPKIPLVTKARGPLPTLAPSGKKKDKNPTNLSHLFQNRKRAQWAARPGEQVAAKVTRTDENGSWILASVQRFYPDTETYDVQDEDDTSKLIRLPWSHVMRLSTGGEGCFTKGADCMAIFPETTSFYKAKVAKSPVWKLEHHNHTAAAGTGVTVVATGNNTLVPVVKEIIVKFEDDEDTTTGKTPHRRVPARYVIPVPSKYFYEEEENVDLTPPQSTVGTAMAVNGGAVSVGGK